MKRAELRERDRPGDDQPSAAVGDLEAVDRPGHVGVLAARRPRGPRRGSRPSVRADRPAGRCRCRRAGSDPARPCRARPVPSRRRAARRGPGSSSGRCRRAAGFQSRSKTPSGPVTASSTTWPPSATRTRAPGRPRPVFMSWAKTRSCSRERLDDRVEVAADHERRRLERLLVGHLDDVDARQLELLQLVVALDRLVPGVAGHRARSTTASGATRPMSSDSTFSSAFFLRKYASALSL